MARSKRVPIREDAYHEPPALTPEDRTDQLVALAFDLAEERLRDKSASNQLIAEIMRYGSAKERLQNEKIQRENEMLKVKAEAYKAMQHSQEMYEKVLAAMKSYSGHFDEEEPYEEY